MIQGLFGYALINFAALMYLDWGNRPAAPDEMTPQQWRLFSGHWMLFYSLSFGMLYSAHRKEERPGLKTRPYE